VLRLGWTKLGSGEDGKLEAAALEAAHPARLAQHPLYPGPVDLHGRIGGPQLRDDGTAIGYGLGRLHGGQWLRRAPEAGAQLVGETH
jgi:hypothetical protein